MAKKAKQEPAGDFVGGVDLAEVERLLAFMQKHGLEEFEYEQGGVHIRLKKAAGAPAGIGAPPMQLRIATATRPLPQRRLRQLPS